jgi:hypothetical protein
MRNTYGHSNKELKNAKTRYKPRVYLLPRKLAMHRSSQAAKYSPSVQLGHLLDEGLPHIQKTMNMPPYAAYTLRNSAGCKVRIIP